MDALLLIIIVLIYHINITSSATNCSAIQSYVQITSPTNLSATLTSSKALFAPYSYYIPPTQLVTLHPSNDDICSPNGLTTDISSKMVLIFESHGDCTNHYKVYIAQQNNAIAVLLANNDISGQVINIIDDNINITTTIPTRRIPHTDGTTLKNALSSGSIITIEFACFPTDYPTNLCLLDLQGDYWYLDGDYQRQQNTFNGHPVYKKEGYVYLLNNLYIFQHNGDGTTDWYWAITLDSNFLNDKLIRAKCNTGNIYSPSLCPLWNTMAKKNTFTSYPFMNITNNLCFTSDAFLCIESKQSTLSGLDGTYKQFNTHVPYWFRELDTCDTRPGFFTFSNGAFILFDSFNSWMIASCVLDPYYDNEWEWVRFYPSLCTTWSSIMNDTLVEKLSVDESLSVKMDTKCERLCNASVHMSVTSKLCMDKSSVMHGFLEGEYVLTGVVGVEYGTYEYIRVEQLYYDGVLVSVYVWWFGEINVDYSWWVLSESSLSEAISVNGDVKVYGYCESATASPIHCAAGWKFYFINAFHFDAGFKVYEGDCEEGPAREEYVWPDYVCVGFVNQSVGSDSRQLEDALFVGGYQINTTSTSLSNGYPHWIKPKNENWRNSQIYLYFDAFFGYWQIGDGLHVDQGSVLVCFQGGDDYSPIDCNKWYDISLTSMDNMYLYQCTENDILRLAENKVNNSINPGEIIGIISVILFCICCMAILYWFYHKNAISSTQVLQTNMENTDNRNTIISSDAGAGLTSNAATMMQKADFTMIDVEEPKTPEESLPETDLMDEKTIINTKESDTVSDVDDNDESQIEDDDEKKDEDEKGIDSRRMSQQMIVAMQSDLDEWTNALINDPSTASRRYSRHSQNESKFVIDIMNNKSLDNLEKKEVEVKESLDPLYDESGNKNVDNESDKEVVGGDDDDDNDNVITDDIMACPITDDNIEEDDKPSEWTEF